MARKNKTIIEPSDRQLHDRATRGETLTESEQRTLNTWYAQQDEVESALLGSSPVASLSTLQAQVDAALVRLQSVSQRIQILTEENDALRQQNDALVEQLKQTPTQTA